MDILLLSVSVEQYEETSPLLEQLFAYDTMITVKGKAMHKEEEAGILRSVIGSKTIFKRFSE